MNDGNASLNELKERVHALCLRKGWGVDGVQNPQQVAMAMTVEMSELLEHFQWMNAEDVRALYACIMALSRGEQERLLKEAGV